MITPCVWLLLWLALLISPASAAMANWWPLMEGTGTIANDVRGVSDGTLTAMEAGDWLTTPVIGGLVFGGTDEFVDLGTDSSLKPAALPISIAVWVNATSAAVEKQVFTNDQGSSASANHSGAILLLNADLTTFTGYGDNTGSASADRRNKSSTNAITADTWTHVVAVIRAATDMSLYINSVEAGGTYSGTGGTMAYSGRPGSFARRGTNFSAIQLKDVRQYNHALSVEEIDAIRTRGRMAR